MAGYFDQSSPSISDQPHAHYCAHTCTIVRMILDRPFLTVTPSVDGDILEIVARADAAFTAPRLHQIAGRHSLSGVRKAVARLAGQGVIEVEKVGRTSTYRLNRDHLAAAAIIELASMSDALVEQIRRAASAWVEAPTLVMLFGSSATGQMRVDSDIDVFVVGPSSSSADREVWASQITELEQAVTRWTGNDARVLEYTPTELGHGDDPVADDIRRDGIFVVGDRQLLRRRVG